MHAGLELSGRMDFSSWLPSGHSVFVGAAYTRIALARFNSDLVTGGVNVRGNRLPYAPGHTLSPNVQYRHRTGVSVMFSPEYVSRQFSDNLNRIAPAANGASGEVPGYTVVNAAVNVPLGAGRPVLFVNVSNLGDRRFIVSRVDGIHVGRPRQAFAGIRWDF